MSYARACAQPMRVLLLAAVLCVPTLADAVTLSLDARASEMVANDEMIVRLAVEREGPLPGALNEEVLAQLNGAIAEAKELPGISARLGGLHTIPLIDGNDRTTRQWRVRGDIVLESREVNSLSWLAGRLAARMQLDGVAFRLSRQARAERAKGLLEQAAAAFRGRAAAAAAAFGFEGYRIQELSLLDSEPPVRPMNAAVMRPMAESRARVPTEGGESEVVVTVSGVVVLQ